jgi:hypothetical protein
MMLHIVGFGYDFSNEDVLEYRAEEQAARES